MKKLTKLGMLQRAEFYTLDLIGKQEKANEAYKATKGRDNPITTKLIKEYWDDIRAIWEEMEKAEKEQ